MRSGVLGCHRKGPGEVFVSLNSLRITLWSQELGEGNCGGRVSRDKEGSNMPRLPFQGEIPWAAGDCMVTGGS